MLNWSSGRDGFATIAMPQQAEPSTDAEKPVTDAATAAPAPTGKEASNDDVDEEQARHNATTTHSAPPRH